MTPPSISVASLETSVENVDYERLEDNTTTSIPMQPSLRLFQGITEEANFEDGEDSDGEIGPFFDAVEREESMDDAYDENPILSLETSIESNDADVPPPPPFTRGRTDKTRNLKIMPIFFLLEPFDVVHT